MKNKTFKWWLGLIIAILTALLTYLTGCSTKTQFTITADEISNPVIQYTDSTGVQNFLKR